MTDYEMLLDEAAQKGLIVSEVPFVFYDGLIKGNKIGIRDSLETDARKADILAEEISHYDLNIGNILDQSLTENRKQEYKARKKCFDMRIGLSGIINALEFGCRNAYEASEYLGVSEQAFTEAVECYRKKYGVYVQVGHYTLVFEPSLDLMITTPGDLNTQIPPSQ